MSPQIVNAGLVLSSAMLILSLGCSEPNTPGSLIDPDTGKHVDLWETPDSHGAVAKAAAASSSGFAVCQECHADNFTGGISHVTCLNTAGCHGESVSAPHSPKPWRGGTRTHTNTDQSNAPVCALCHTNGANSSVQPSPFDPGAAPGCFNNTLCHAVAGHLAGWEDPASHGAAAKNAPSSTTGFSYCQTCHGDDFTGGTALQTCLNTAGCHGAGVNAPHSPQPWRGGAQTHTTTNASNAPACGLCHLNGRTPPSYAAVPAGTTPSCFDNTLCHAQVAAPHGVPYTDATLHGPAAKADLTYCQACHSDQPAGGTGSNPRFNIAIGSLANGCEDCHAANTSHAVPWTGVNATSHQTAANMAAACVLCHGANLEGGAGPACSSCHTAGSPLTLLDCTSCHGKPPSGSASPNVAGSHSKHDALAYVTGVCNSCHTGAGSDTVNHNNALVNVAFLTAYNAKSGTASFNAGSKSCTNISCHGGQATPGWLTGTINVNAQCTSCHSSGSAQHNSYNSGEHTKHIADVGADCIDCHDTTKLAAVHFDDLNTAAMLQSAQTMTSVYNTSGKYCAFTCHLHGTNEPHDSGMTW